MTDPYQILGVSPQASDDEVKKAYRELSKKYHPDHNSGVLEDIANEKMAEINKAYDDIMDMRRNGGGYQQSSGQSQSQGYSSSGNNYASSYNDIRSMIENRNYTAADNALNSSRNDNSAEWNFLKATVCVSRGWMDEAYRHYERAVQLEPGNREYSMAFSQIQNKRRGNMYGNPYVRQNNRGYSDSSGCNNLCTLCECLVCADCLCDCF